MRKILKGKINLQTYKQYAHFVDESQLIFIGL